MPINYNKIKIPTDGNSNTPIENPSSTSGVVSVYFRDAMDTLVKKIEEADYVIGCVAWLTHPLILRAMSNCIGVNVVVAKEDWLRPDTIQTNLKELYSHLQPITSDRGLRELPFMDRTLWDVSTCGSIADEPVRCFGGVNTDKKLAWSRLHHKFLLFGRYDNQAETIQQPYAVWTGSLNFTHNSNNSLENGVYMTDPVIVNSYTREFTQILALSEPLNWNHVYCAPEYRIGT